MEKEHMIEQNGDHSFACVNINEWYFHIVNNSKIFYKGFICSQNSVVLLLIKKFLEIFFIYVLTIPIFSFVKVIVLVIKKTYEV